MAKSLQEQLIESGLAKAGQAKKPARKKNRKSKQTRQAEASAGANPELQAELQRKAAAKRERDRALNEQRKASREAREREAENAQIIETHRVARPEASDETVDYNYSSAGKIRKVAVSSGQRDDLAAGRLGIVRYRGETALLPRAIIEKLQDRLPDRIWLVTEDDETSAADDPYADFQVPDDLTW
jgi:uncharacterized protein YaiL (DUF2058 family)